MKRTVLLTALVAVASLAFGCGRSGQPPEKQVRPIESSAGNQTITLSGSEASAPVDQPQTVSPSGNITEREQVRRTVEVGCGKCMFKMKGVDSCELAIMIDAKAYLVTGVHIDPTESGLCKTVKKARVLGRLVQYGEGLTIGEHQGEFIAESIELQE
jgi:hypothetical protein